MRFKPKLNPSSSAPLKRAPSFNPKMPMVPPRKSLRGTMGGTGPAPDLSKRPPVPPRLPNVIDNTGSKGALKYMVGTPTKSMMKKGGAVKKAAAKKVKK